VLCDAARHTYKTGINLVMWQSATRQGTKITVHVNRPLRLLNTYIRNGFFFTMLRDGLRHVDRQALHSLVMWYHATRCDTKITVHVNRPLKMLHNVSFCLPFGKTCLKRVRRWSTVSRPSGQSFLNRLNQSMICTVDLLQ
jgi:hypothetical protein